MTDDYRGLAWEHGMLTVQRLGAMLAPVTFLVGGRQISPLHVAPWAGEAGTEELPGILQRLRGEWPCIPFGYTVPADGFSDAWKPFFTDPIPDEEVHGPSSNHPWTWEDAEEGTLRMSLEYPASSDIARVERRIVPDPNAPAIDVELRVEPRRDCRLPIGLHPCFKLPARAGAARIEPAAFDHGLTYPGAVEPGASLFAENDRFTDLAKVPGRDGKAVDATRVPVVPDVEELLQLNGIDGAVSLRNDEENYRVTLSWQKEHFPSLLLWFSNRGRKAAPWSGRHVGLGMEPICSPIGLGPGTALLDNPIAASGTPTAHEFRAGTPFVTRYRFAVEVL